MSSFSCLERPGLASLRISIYHGTTDQSGWGVLAMSIAVEAPPSTTTRNRPSPVLVAMADTFIGGMGHPGSPIRVAGSMDDIFERLPSRSDRRRLRVIVRVFGSRAGTLLLTGRPLPFHHWPREERIALMSRWSTSCVTFRRQLFQVFKRLSLLAFLGDTEAGADELELPPMPQSRWLPAVAWAAARSSTTARAFAHLTGSD